MKNKSAVIKNILKFGFVIAIFYFLAQKDFISVEAMTRAFSQKQYIYPAIGALFCTTFLSVIRWHLLLKAQDIHLKWSRTLQLVFIGNFFNIALPGAVSGDFVKAFYVGREAEGKRARAFGSILFDRVAGLSALLLVAAGALAIDLDTFVGTPFFGAIKFFILMMALGFLSFYAYLFLVREHHDPVLKLFRSLELRNAKAGALTRIYESLRHYHNHRITVLKVMAISAVIHLTVCWACLQFALALGETQIPSLPVFVAVPLGMLVTAIPVMPAGVGTGHVAFSGLFHLLGSERGADLFSLFIVTQLISGAIGGLVYLRFRSHEPSPQMDPIPNGALSS